MPRVVLAQQASRPGAYRLERDLPYRADADLPAEARDRCKLDLYVPTESPGFATVIWFHGGGLTKGEKSIPTGLQNQGLAVVAPNYRLAPAAQSPAYIEDAAAAVAWTLREIERRGGSRQRVFVSGHSAGGYLAAMVTLDKRWLKPHGIDPNELAGAIPYSGQCITHFTIRAERGIPDKQPVIDEFAPLYHVRGDAPPLLLITGDRERELLGRYEETAYFARMLKIAGHKQVQLFELQGFDHGGMAEPAHPLLLRFVKERVAELSK
ncbi:MAG: alpha/beta hydrolase [Planctomycetaceae bacterium]